MRIQYLDNSGFAVYLGDTALVFDYWNFTPGPDGEGIVRAEDLARAERVYVFASHKHFDHYNRKIFTLRDLHPQVTYVLDRAIVRCP